MDLSLRAAVDDDLADLTDLYNHYVRTSPATFDLDEWTVDGRRAWFSVFAPTGRYRCIVAADGGRAMGYACSTAHRAKAAYAPSIETSVYLHPDAVGHGLGRRLYVALFDALAGEDVHRAYAGITLPNPPSVALHEALGFRRAGLFTEQGRKFGRWWDVAWYERALGDADA